VFAYSWNQKLNYPDALMNRSATMDELFMTAGSGGPNGFIGWRNSRHASERTPGATNHLDPHSNSGYLRAVSGNLAMTTDDWRSGAVPSDEPPVPPQAEGPPQITKLTASVDPSFSSGDGMPSFYPNGDGIDEQLFLRHRVTRESDLVATVRNAAGSVVSRYTVWSAAGYGGSRWNGRDMDNRFVPDGVYRLTYVARDAFGVAGDPVTTRALVLTSIALPKPSKAAFYATDGDSLYRSVTLPVKVNKAAVLTWQIVGSDGTAVRSVRAADSVTAGTIKFAWDGRAADGSWASSGWYRSVVTASTEHGTYTQERLVYLGGFRVTPSIASVARGGKVTLTIVSTEPLSGAPRVHFSQPGMEPWTATAKRVRGKKYKLTITVPTGGGAGALEMLISATDREGGRNEGTASLPLL
jgi:flagellar hook assembly protein FlgD